ncbi:molybdate ABC transporter substrate-binding protein [Methanocella sp. CWC-04]|uniref:Molybdate ABC transporter substrate-binding protein n=1 Tax=Methanooceanicella nereidis TaxID=2052831 RepID=A0AAP2RCU3_9EURY|nr:molybdate ABC transporter substrate-binding protein [Methanocella sp. CWC-04]MCD1294290.1 molybdate ABC transporter substrate-binding protein [Methanocella sp. CWC-04]
MNKKRSMIGLAIIALAITIIVSGCTTGTGPTATPGATETPTEKIELTVFAAASLTDCFTEMKNAFMASNENIDVVTNFDGSQALRTQIEQGAYADVFASASTKHMNAVKDAGYMVNDTVVNFANNKLCVITPKDNPANVNTLSDLANPGVKIVIGTPECPVGAYAVQIIDKMGNDSAYGPEYKQKVLDNVVSKETTVTMVVSKVALGEADAGFVYVSDVPQEYKEKVNIISIPDNLNVIAVYPIGVLDESGRQDSAKKFVDFVKSSEGKAILEKYGFTGV